MINTETEVRIPLYDRDWINIQDVIDTLEGIVTQLKHDQKQATNESAWIEIEWESAAKADVQFIRGTHDYSYEQVWLRYGREVAEEENA